MGTAASGVLAQALAGRRPQQMTAGERQLLGWQAGMAVEAGD